MGSRSYIPTTVVSNYHDTPNTTVAPLEAEACGFRLPIRWGINDRIDPIDDLPLAPALRELGFPATRPVAVVPVTGPITVEQNFGINFIERLDFASSNIRPPPIELGEFVRRVRSKHAAHAPRGLAVTEPHELPWRFLAPAARPASLRLRLPSGLLLLAFRHVRVVNSAVAKLTHLRQDVLQVRLEPLLLAGLPRFLVERFLLPLRMRRLPVVEHLSHSAAAVVVIPLTQRARTARCSQCESRTLRKTRTGDHHSPVASADHSPHTHIGFSSLFERLRVLASRSMRSAGEDDADDDRNCDRRTRRRCVGA